MGWRSTTFVEISNKIKADVSSIKEVALFNNQLDAWRGEVNDDFNLPIPTVLLEIVGGDCEHVGFVRTYPAHIFRLHVVQECYQSEHTNTPTSLAHLDFIDLVTNSIDGQSFTYASSFEYQSYEIDQSRTNLIVHILTFSARVQDDSLAIQNAAQQATPTNIYQEVHIKQDIISDWATQNNYRTQ